MRDSCMHLKVARVQDSNFRVIYLDIFQGRSVPRSASFLAKSPTSSASVSDPTPSALPSQQHPKLSCQACPEGREMAASNGTPPQGARAVPLVRNPILYVLQLMM